ncbi:FAST kinase domain-containing 1, mitochondrial [Pelobates cultripes]|uniref:FAST kinase domain-containing 1, mitochondrial n=1 Tax=Pelobates cultripes TaxID=61616 RepID=A0AAD1SRG0_PELCU|nr:FAST kinase domain-containing 1, mitochondrial [Pelobates cultripes]
MFRCLSRCRLSLRINQARFMTTDPLLDQLKTCVGEDQVLQLIGKNKAKLSVTHVGYAINMLWHFQKEKANTQRTIDQIRNHPDFIALRILAENKIDLMDDNTLVETLYNMLRFNLSELSKFSVCLTEQHMNTSPIIGQIASIVDKRLDDLQDARILSSLMVSICAVISQRLRDRLIEKAEFLMDGTGNCHFNQPRRIVQFLRNIKYTHRPLLEKCTQRFIQGINEMDPEILCIVIGLYQSLQFHNSDFRLMAKARLLEVIDQCHDIGNFTKLFATLGPMANQEIREKLEEDAMSVVDKMSPQQIMAILGTLEEMECRNTTLIQKVASLLHKYLDFYRPIDLAKVTQALVFMHCQTPEVFAQLQKLLIRSLKASFIPSEVARLTRVLTMLPSPRVDEEILSKVEATLPQCSLSDLSTLAMAIIKWMRIGTTSHHSSSIAYGNLLKKLNSCGLKRIQQIDSIDLFLDELKYMTGDWLEEVLLGETINTFDRLLDQVSWQNIPDIALFITRTHYRHPPLLDKIASVTMENISKIHYSATYAILLPFIVLNYESTQCEEFFDACIQHFLPHLNSFDPHLLVLIGYALAVAEYFPEELIKTIFNIDFLGKLDAQLETLPAALNVRIRLRLMQLNRAVCLECPEYQIPWFHDRYCQQVQRKVNGSINSVQRQIHQLLGEILGGINYVKVSVMTPYYHSIDFECILDKNKKPIPYMDQNMLSADLSKLQWGLDKQLGETKSLPPGAQRVAVEFLDSKAFCKNSSHIKGEYIMKKRHLEMLGYHVVQISSLEWNSMELSTKAAWKEYLRKNLFENDL